jgi:hypothetical protein
MDLILNQITCSFAQDKHIIECAIALSCGHFICKKCIPPNSNNSDQVMCLKCNRFNEIPLGKCNEVELIRLLIESNISSLAKTTREKIDSEYGKYQSINLLAKQ